MKKEYYYTKCLYYCLSIMQEDDEVLRNAIVKVLAYLTLKLEFFKKEYAKYPKILEYEPQQLSEEELLGMAYKQLKFMESEKLAIDSEVKMLSLVLKKKIMMLKLKGEIKR